jgi:iron complex outermembrane receptor protein
LSDRPNKFKLASVRVALLLLLAGSAAMAQEIGEEIVVTPARAPQKASDALSPVTVVPTAAIADSKAVDETLRNDPSYATFRRSSSLVADPSSQGVNLRGIGPSGISRALVLDDGVPLNDGFGGWVYWDSIPRLSIERVEIAEGASSALYGSAAMGGVLQLVSRPIVDRAIIEIEGGSFDTGSAAISAAKTNGEFGLAIDLEGLTTNGHQVIASPGAVDQNASSQHASGLLRGEMLLENGGRIFFRAGGFLEGENGGTPLTTANARQADYAIGLSEKDLELRFFGRFGRFDQGRSKILPDAFTRTSEQLASNQSAPEDSQGFSAQYRAPYGITIGTDLQRVFGKSLEALQPPSTLTVRDSSGAQLSGGVFAEELLQISALSVQGALRYDYWENLGYARVQTSTDGSVQSIDLGQRTDGQLSPRLAVRYKFAPLFALRAAIYRAFRAPTLNELYRPFQVGPVRTDANAALGPESYLGGEAGFDIGPYISATGFSSQLQHPIVNVTIGPNEQQRQNLGEARFAGLELRGQYSPIAEIHLTAAYTYVRSRVAGTSLSLPEDPEHRLAGSIAFARKDLFSLILRARWMSSQFEDDQNTLRLPGFAVFDATISRELGAHWEIFGSLENALDRKYLVGLQGGVASIGQPICLRLGGRWSAF